MMQHIIVIHSTSTPWSAYCMMGACTCFVTFRIIIKLTRRILSQSWQQEVFLITGWAGALAMTILLGYSFAQNGTDLTAFLLYCNYLYIITSHAIKVSIALLFIRLGQIEEYKVVNRLLVPLVIISFTSNLVFLSAECHLNESGRCSFEALGWFQTISNTVLGLMLTIHPLRPLYLASRSLNRYSVILLAILFSTGLAESMCSIARAIIINHNYKHNRHSLKRIQALSFWLMLETTLSIILAVIPEIGGTALYLYNSRRRGQKTGTGWVIRKRPSQILQGEVGARRRSPSNASTESSLKSPLKSPFSDDYESPLQSPQIYTVPLNSREWDRHRADLLSASTRWPRLHLPTQKRTPTL